MKDKKKVGKQQVEFKFYKADVPKLLKAILSTGKFPAQIASAGGLGRDCMKKARDGNRITATKAAGICNGLNACGCKPEAVLEVLFPHGES